MPEFFDVVASQRACRWYTDDPVSDELVERALTAATFAPSAENSQPWRFVVVRDGEHRASIGDLTRRAWRGGAKSWSEERLTSGLFADVERGAEGGVSGAPVLVVVCAAVDEAVESTVASSIFPAVQNLLLAAGALGLGCALTTLPAVFGEELSSLLGLPSTVRPIAVVPLGYPARTLGPPRRRPMATSTYRERYGEAW